MKKTGHADVLCLRIIDALRRGEGFCVQDGSRIVSYYPIESLNKNIKLPARRTLILSSARAGYLGFSHHVFNAAKLSPMQLRHLADPMAKKIKFPKLAPCPEDTVDTLAVQITKQALLLPALIKTTGTADKSWPTIDVKILKKFIKSPSPALIETGRAKLPLKGAENATLISFRHGRDTHLALLIGNIKSLKYPLTRVHSSCVTGDILGSLRCDCGSQLQVALARIIAEGTGILIYLHQEGRGIGITNKLRAYALQEQGMDTYEANRMLGFDEDERDFAVASNILKKLNIFQCRLLTNNPDKLAQLKKHGIQVSERVKIAAPPGQHNHAYLTAKAQKSGHLF